MENQCFADKKPKSLMEMMRLYNMVKTRVKKRSKNDNVHKT